MSYCYGVNASDISKLEICTDALKDVKIRMGHENIANSPLSKALFGLSGNYLYVMLNLGLGILFNQIDEKWPDCTPYAKQAICQFLFPPLVGGSDTVLELNQSMCFKARNSKCHKGWQEADKVINKFVTQCNKTYPILNLLHMPYCEQMPETSLVEAPTCSFAGKYGTTYIQASLTTTSPLLILSYTSTYIIGPLYNITLGSASIH